MPLREGAKRALASGEKKIPEFQKFFPQGMDYEVYDCSFRVKLSKCRVPEEGIHFLAQSTRKPMLYALFSEFDAEIIPNYCLVYYRKEFFCYVPLSPNQLERLSLYNSDFYQAWMYSKGGWLDPGDAIFSPLNFMLDKTFHKGVKICGDFFKNMLKILRKNPEDTMQKINLIFEKANNKILKKYKKFEIINDFELYYELATSLNNKMKSELSDSLYKIRTGPTADQSVASFFIGSPATKLNVEPLYIIPNDKTTIAMLLIPNSGFSFKYFVHYQFFYSLVKRLHAYLNQLNVMNPNA